MYKTRYQRGKVIIKPLKCDAALIALTTFAQ